jgi:hypothetical protein
MDGENQLCNGGKGPDPWVPAGLRTCYNFSSEFAASFNSWHVSQPLAAEYTAACDSLARMAFVWPMDHRVVQMWATNFTQDLLSKTTGGPVIQGPLASMNNAIEWQAQDGRNGSGCQGQPVPTEPGTGCITDPNYCSFDGILAAQSSGMAVFEARGPCIPKERCLAAFLAAAEPGTYMHCVYNGDQLLNATSFPEIDYKLGAPHGKAVETEPGSNVWRRVFGSGTVVTWNNNNLTGTIAWSAAARLGSAD